MYKQLSRFLLGCALLTTAPAARSQTVEPPAIEGKHPFAILVDAQTAEKCRPQIQAYKQTLESEGLPVYVVSNTWTAPE